MSDKIEFGKSGYKDFQSALDSLGTDAMEQAIESAFQQLTAEEEGETLNPKQETPEHTSSIPSSMLKQLSIEAMEQLVSEAFNSATGKRYHCAIQGINFNEAEKVQLNLTLSIADE